MDVCVMRNYGNFIPRGNQRFQHAVLILHEHKDDLFLNVMDKYLWYSAHVTVLLKCKAGRRGTFYHNNPYAQYFSCRLQESIQFIPHPRAYIERHYTAMYRPSITITDNIESEVLLQKYCPQYFNYAANRFCQLNISRCIEGLNLAHPIDLSRFDLQLSVFSCDNLRKKACIKTIIQILPPCFIFFTALGDYKEHHRFLDVINAFNLFKYKYDKYFGHEIMLVLGGNYFATGSVECKYRRHLRSSLESVKKDHNVIFLKKTLSQAEKKTLLRLSYAAIYLEDSPDFQNIRFAMSLGTPIICSSIGLAANMVAHGSSGFTVEPKRVDYIAACMETLSLPTVYHRFSLAVRKEYLKNYSETSLFLKTVSVKEIPETKTPEISANLGNKRSSVFEEEQQFCVDPIMGINPEIIFDNVSQLKWSDEDEACHEMYGDHLFQMEPRLQDPSSNEQLDNQTQVIPHLTNFNAGDQINLQSYQSQAKEPFQFLHLKPFQPPPVETSFKLSKPPIAIVEHYQPSSGEPHPPLQFKSGFDEPHKPESGEPYNLPHIDPFHPLPFKLYSHEPYEFHPVKTYQPPPAEPFKPVQYSPNVEQYHSLYFKTQKPPPVDSYQPGSIEPSQFKPVEPSQYKPVEPSQYTPIKPSQSALVEPFSLPHIDPFHPLSSKLCQPQFNESYQFLPTKVYQQPSPIKPNQSTSIEPFKPYHPPPVELYQVSPVKLYPHPLIEPYQGPSVEPNQSIPYKTYKCPGVESYQPAPIKQCPPPLVEPRHFQTYKSPHFISFQSAHQNKSGSVEPFTQPSIESYESRPIDPYQNPQFKLHKPAPVEPCQPLKRLSVESYQPALVEPFKPPPVEIYCPLHSKTFKLPSVAPVEPYQFLPVDQYVKPFQCAPFETYQVSPVKKDPQPFFESYQTPPVEAHQSVHVEPYQLSPVQACNAPIFNTNRPPLAEPYELSPMEPNLFPTVDQYQPLPIKQSVEPHPLLHFKSVEQYQSEPVELRQTTPNEIYCSQPFESYQPYPFPSIETYQSTPVKPYQPLPVEIFQPPFVESNHSPVKPSIESYQPVFNESFESPSIKLYHPVQLKPYQSPPVDLNSSLSFKSYQLPSGEICQSLREHPIEPQAQSYPKENIQPLEFMKANFNQPMQPFQPMLPYSNNDLQGYQPLQPRQNQTMQSVESRQQYTNEALEPTPLQLNQSMELHTEQALQLYKAMHLNSNQVIKAFQSMQKLNKATQQPEQFIQKSNEPILQSNQFVQQPDQNMLQLNQSMQQQPKQFMQEPEQSMQQSNQSMQQPIQFMQQQMPTPFPNQPIRSSQVQPNYVGFTEQNPPQVVHPIPKQNYPQPQFVAPNEPLWYQMAQAPSSTIEQFSSSEYSTPRQFFEPEGVQIAEYEDSDANDVYEDPARRWDEVFANDSMEEYSAHGSELSETREDPWSGFCSDESPNTGNTKSWRVFNCTHRTNSQYSDDVWEEANQYFVDDIQVEHHHHNHHDHGHKGNGSLKVTVEVDQANGCRECRMEQCVKELNAKVDAKLENNQGINTNFPRRSTRRKNRKMRKTYSEASD